VRSRRSRFGLVGIGLVTTIAACGNPTGMPGQASASHNKVAGASTKLRLYTVGDSVPFFLAREGFEQLRTRPSFVVLDGAIPACAFPSQATAFSFDPSNPAAKVFSTRPCDRGWGSSVRAFRPDMVLFTMADISGDLRYRNRWIHPCMPAFDHWFAQSLRQAVNTLTAYGAHMVIATSAYSEYFGIPTEKWVQTDCMNRIEHAVGTGDSRVSVVDLGHYICPSKGHCRETIDGVSMRPDGVHYRGRSAMAVATWLFTKLDRIWRGPPITVVSSA
jgi:hypothetical protein